MHEIFVRHYYKETSHQKIVLHIQANMQWPKQQLHTIKREAAQARTWDLFANTTPRSRSRYHASTTHLCIDYDAVRDRRGLTMQTGAAADVLAVLHRLMDRRGHG
jgi:hypothetical protein